MTAVKKIVPRDERDRLVLMLVKAQGDLEAEHRLLQRWNERLQSRVRELELDLFDTKDMLIACMAKKLRIPRAGGVENGKSA